MVREEIREKDDGALAIQCKNIFILTSRKHLHEFEHRDPGILDGTRLESQKQGNLHFLILVMAFHQASCFGYSWKLLENNSCWLCHHCDSVNFINILL